MSRGLTATNGKLQLQTNKEIPGLLSRIDPLGKSLYHSDIAVMKMEILKAESSFGTGLNPNKSS